MLQTLDYTWLGLTTRQASKPFLVMAERESEREGFLEIGKENERGMTRRRRWRGEKGSERWVGKESVVYKNAEGGLRILLSVNNVESQILRLVAFVQSQWSHVTQLLHCKQGGHKTRVNAMVRLSQYVYNIKLYEQKSTSLCSAVMWIWVQTICDK